MSRGKRKESGCGHQREQAVDRQHLSTKTTRQLGWMPSSSGYRGGLLSGDELSQIAQQVVSQFRKAVDFLLRVDGVLFAQLLRFFICRRQRVQVSGKASGTCEEVSNLSLNRSVEQIQSTRI